MINRLSERDKRTLKIGAVCAAAVLVFGFGTKWFEHWGKTKEELATIRDNLKLIESSEAQQAGILSIVPVFEMPEAEEEQKVLFRDKLNEQLRKLGINSDPLQYQASAQKQAGYKLLRLKCTAKCQFNQVLDLLAELKQNPYLVSIEEIRIKSVTIAAQQPGQRGGQAQPGRGQPTGQAQPDQGPSSGQRGQRGQAEQQQQVDLTLILSTYAK